MKNERQSGETNEGRSRDEQGGGVEVRCGDGIGLYHTHTGICYI